VLGKYDGEIITGFVGHTDVGGKPVGPTVLDAGGTNVEIYVIRAVGIDEGRSFELTTTLFVDEILTTGTLDGTAIIVTITGLCIIAGLANLSNYDISV